MESDRRIEGLFEGRDRENWRVEYKSRADLVFGSNSVLRAVAEVYPAAMPHGSLLKTAGSVGNEPRPFRPA